MCTPENTATVSRTEPWHWEAQAVQRSCGVSILADIKSHLVVVLGNWLKMVLLEHRDWMR